MKLTQSDNAVNFNGSITFENASAILHDFNQLNFQNSAIELYCAGINNASSVSLAVLIEMVKVAEIKNKTVTISGLSNPLKALAQVSQLSKLFN